MSVNHQVEIARRQLGRRLERSGGRCRPDTFSNVQTGDLQLYHEGKELNVPRTNWAFNIKGRIYRG